MRRRHVIRGMVGLALTVPVVRLFAEDGGDDPVQAAASPRTGADFEPLTLTDAQWRQRLTPEEYRILRQAGTERAGTSPLLSVKAEGEFVCAGCGLALFKSRWKYHSGTGWPSFWDHIDGHLAFKVDHVLVMPRKEYHCARCGGHQGHVFKDGPEPTGLRYCNNGRALDFIPAGRV